MDRKEYYHNYYLKNKERILEKQRLHNTQYYEKNKDYLKNYYITNKDKILEYSKQSRSTKIGRANNLLKAYKQSDKLHKRGECNLTPEWILENIFTKSCAYCGETDWHKLGCDRIDNSKPHTIDNVVCSCWECNRKKK